VIKIGIFTTDFNIRQIALWRLINSKGKQGHKVSGRTYEQLRIEYSKLLSKHRKGKPSPNKGNIYNEKTKQKMRDSSPRISGKDHNRYGKPWPKEYIKIFTEKSTGENNPMYGKSIESIWIKKYGKVEANIRWKESNKKRSINGKGKGTKPVEQYDKQMNLVTTYNSMSEASNQTGTNINCISYVCKGDRKYAGGFIWKWKNKKNK
jgi:hypothetical protein